MTAIVIVSLIGAAAFFVAGLLAGIRRGHQMQGASNAADRLRTEFRDDQRQARAQLERRLDDLYGKLEAIQKSLSSQQQTDASDASPEQSAEQPDLAEPERDRAQAELRSRQKGE